MRLTALYTTVLVGLAGCITGPSALTDEPTYGDTADDIGPVDLGDFLVSYLRPSDTNLRDWHQWLKSQGIEDTIAKDMNQTFALPWDADVLVMQCDTANAFWSPQDRALILCVDLLPSIWSSFANANPDATSGDLDDQTLYTWIFIQYHEYGHALIHMLDLPTTGAEEDAADQFASFLLIEGGNAHMALFAALFWQLVDDGQTTAVELADEHSLNRQRLYNILCLVYGSDPSTFDFLIDYYPEMEARSARCPDEYESTRKAWRELFGPHVKR